MVTVNTPVLKTHVLLNSPKDTFKRNIACSTVENGSMVKKKKKKSRGSMLNGEGGGKGTKGRKVGMLRRRRRWWKRRRKVFRNSQ